MINRRTKLHSLDNFVIQTLIVNMTCVSWLMDDASFVKNSTKLRFLQQY